MSEDQHSETEVTPGGTDARTLPRLPVRLAVSARGVSAVLGRTRDISLHGLYLETHQPFEVGTVLPLVLDLQDGTPLALRAEIVRRDADGMGLRFHNDDPAALRRLRRWHVEKSSVQGTQRQAEQLRVASADVEPVRSPTRIRQMLEEIRDHRAVVTMVPPVRISRDYAKLKAVEADGLRFLSEDASTLQVGETIYGVVTRLFHAWSFSLEVIRVDGRAVHTTLPEEIMYAERRGGNRQPAPPGSVVRWPAPWRPGGFVEHPVLERSPEGLSFRVPAEGCLLSPGSPLEGAELLVGAKAEALSMAYVRHLTPEGPDGRLDEEVATPQTLRVGISVGVPYAARRAAQEEPVDPADRPPVGVREKVAALAQKARNAASYFWAKGRARVVPTRSSGVESRKLRIKRDPYEIVGLLDTTTFHEGRLAGPLVVVVPGFAGRKEQMSFLAGTMVEGFARQGRDVAVLRFDGTNNLGESGRDADCEADGLHALHYTMSGLVKDVDAVLAWARNNAYVAPTHIVLVSVSMSSIAVRHVLTRPEAADVGLWVSYMGAADAIDAVRHVSGNIDLHAYWSQGQKLGVVSLGGVLGDGDIFWEDLHRLDIGDLAAARREMGLIRADVTWIQGRYDAWMDPRRVQQLIDTPAPGARELVTVESGHLPRTGDVAIAQFVRLTQLVWRHVHRDQLPSFTPSLGRLALVNEAEWAAVRRSSIPDRRGWWKGYLLDDVGLGFDVLELDPHYRDLMDRQADLLVPVGQRVLDLGAGTGNLAVRLVRAGAAEVVAVDLVPEALTKAASKVASDQPLRTVVSDLDGTPRRAMRRWLAGDLPSVRQLAERIPGVHRPSFEHLVGLQDDRVTAALQGREVEVGALAAELRLDPAARRLLHDLQVLGRVERGRLTVVDAQAALQVLPPSLLDGSPQLPFEDGSFDGVGMSLLLSYLDHPDDLLFEAYRVLRPGGRLMLSSLVTDSESSKFYLDLVARFEQMPVSEIPAGSTREDLLDSVRRFADHAGDLCRLEEEGLFRFYDADRLVDLVLRRGFVDAHVQRAWGSPAQAAIVTCRKP